MADWQVIAISLLLIADPLWKSVRHVIERRRPDFEYRVPVGHIVGGNFRHLIILAWFAWLFWNGWLQPQELGLRFDRPVQALVHAVLVWFLFLMAYQLLCSFRPLEADVREYVRTQRMLWPRSASGKILVWPYLILNPVTEELTTRGVLVVLVHKATGSIVAGVVSGLIVCLLMHAYQGLKTLPVHAMFFGTAVMLTYGDYGLLAAIFLHLCGDVTPLFNGRKTRVWIRSQRALRRPAAVQKERVEV